MSEPTGRVLTEKKLKADLGSSDSSSVLSGSSTQNGVSELQSQSSLNKVKTEELLNFSTKDLRAFKQQMEEEMARKKKAEKTADSLIREEAEKKTAETARKEKAKAKEKEQETLRRAELERQMKDLKVKADALRAQREEEEAEKQRQQQLVLEDKERQEQEATEAKKAKERARKAAKKERRLAKGEQSDEGSSAQGNANGIQRIPEGESHPMQKLKDALLSEQQLQGPSRPTPTLSPLEEYKKRLEEESLLAALGIKEDNNARLRAYAEQLKAAQKEKRQPRYELPRVQPTQEEVEAFRGFPIPKIGNPSRAAHRQFAPGQAGAAEASLDFNQQLEELEKSWRSPKRNILDDILDGPIALRKLAEPPERPADLLSPVRRPSPVPPARQREGGHAFFSPLKAASFNTDDDDDDLGDLFCPLTLELMADPVVCADGFSYERSDIESWLKDHDTSPRTNMKLPHKQVLPNRALANLCQRYKLWKEDQRGKKKKETFL